MKKETRGNLMGGAIMLVIITLFMLWAVNQIGNNITQIRGIAADHINEECGTELGYTDVVFDSEGVAVWYVLSTISVRCDESDEAKYLWQIPRPGMGDSTPDTPDDRMPR